MYYSIGEVAEILGLPTSTIRYYDKEGLLPFIERRSGIRKFADSDIGMLKVIECLKGTGMSIKDIRLFSQWCLDGDESLENRRQMFYERKAAALKQMEDLQKTLELIEHKCWYYDKACKEGTESIHKQKKEDKNEWKTAKMGV